MASIPTSKIQKLKIQKNSLNLEKIQFLQEGLIN